MNKLNNSPTKSMYMTNNDFFKNNTKKNSFSIDRNKNTLNSTVNDFKKQKFNDDYINSNNKRKNFYDRANNVLNNSVFHKDIDRNKIKKIQEIRKESKNSDDAFKSLFKESMKMDNHNTLPRIEEKAIHQNDSSEFIIQEEDRKESISNSIQLKPSNTKVKKQDSIQHGVQVENSHDEYSEEEKERPRRASVKIGKAGTQKQNRRVSNIDLSAAKERIIKDLYKKNEDLENKVYYLNESLKSEKNALLHELDSQISALKKSNMIIVEMNNDSWKVHLNELKNTFKDKLQQRNDDYQRMQVAQKDVMIKLMVYEKHVHVPSYSSLRNEILLELETYQRKLSLEGEVSGSEIYAIQKELDLDQYLKQKEINKQNRYIQDLLISDIEKTQLKHIRVIKKRRSFDNLFASQYLYRNEHDVRNYINELKQIFKLKIVNMRRELRKMEGRVKMSNELNKNLMALSKGQDSMGLKDQVTQLENHITSITEEHKKEINNLNDRYYKHMKVRPEEQKKQKVELKDMREMVLKKDNDINDLRNNVKNLKSEKDANIKQYESDIKKLKLNQEKEIEELNKKIEQLDEESKTQRFQISRMHQEMKIKVDEIEKMKVEKHKLKVKLETSLVFDPKNLQLDSIPITRKEKNRDMNKISKILKYNTGFDVLELYSSLCWDNSKLADDTPEFEIQNFELDSSSHELTVTYLNHSGDSSITKFKTSTLFQNFIETKGINIDKMINLV